MRLGKFKPTMQSVSPRTALMLDIRSMERKLKEMNIPQQRLRTSHKPTPMDTVSPKERVMDFHARLRTIIRQANLQDYAPVAYEVGQMHGIVNGIQYNVENAAA
jgi:hypothetical protein